MTETDLVENIIARLKEKEEIKYIKADAISKGFTGEQFEKAYEDAQSKMQAKASRDPFIRLLLGPTLLIIAGVTFYTNYYGRFWGVSTFIGLLALLGGLRLTISLIRQWMGKK
ncbi:MAG: hypothetical protein V4722_11565 [Bacteroidota bacterium]